MADTLMKVRGLFSLINYQRPAREFFKDAQRAEKGNGSVVDLASSSLDEVKLTLDTHVICGEGSDGRDEVERLLEELVMREEMPNEEEHAKEVSQRLGEIAMRKAELGIVHNWRAGNSSTESVCGECGLGIDYIFGSTLIFSEESCWIPWSEWRAGVGSLTDEELLVAMADAEVAMFTHGRKGWEDTGRPKYAVRGEEQVLRKEIARRKLDWWNWEDRWDSFLDSTRRKSENLAQ